ncbi:MAG: 3-oxoacyl-[acyl-carrier-protein] synthase III C-terminal domain-containing protein [Sulfuricurvum sp.]|nr:3-oxoacyl-[acyl-carrier-protein] synthase III C-terminal domain-containing protein [Sulfuricurvum sp.]
MKKDVFIVGVKTVLPNLYSSADVIGKLYSEKLSSVRINKFAKRLGANTQIKNRAISIDLEQFPDKIISEENSPVMWAKSVIQNFSNKLQDDQIEFLSISYNISSHKISIPNLSCQIAHECKLNLRFPPQEIANYGCTSGIFSIQSAVDFCQKRDCLATVFAFEQPSSGFNPIYDDNDINFKASLRTNAIFGDGGAGLLIASGEKAEKFDKKLKIIDIHLDYQFGDVIKMEEGSFYTREGVKDVMPELVSTNIIKPLLKRNNIKIEDVFEWSMHQGGLPILESFMKEDTLGLSESQIEMSKKMFMEYGNVSTPSNFIVFEQHFNNKDAQIGDYGMIVGFGAGYYFGAVLYQHC